LAAVTQQPLDKPEVEQAPPWEIKDGGSRHVENVKRSLTFTVTELLWNFMLVDAYQPPLGKSSLKDEFKNPRTTVRANLKIKKTLLHLWKNFAYLHDILWANTYQQSPHLRVNVKNKKFKMETGANFKM
jgi:hypothetical protein